MSRLIVATPNKTMVYNELLIGKLLYSKATTKKERGMRREKHFLYYDGLVLKKAVSSIMTMLYDKLIIRVG